MGNTDKREDAEGIQISGDYLAMTAVKDIIKKLTLDEKCALCSGVTNWNTTPISRLNVPTIVVSDGPHGLRREQENPDVANIMQESRPATCFPPAVTLASSWDREIAAKVGSAIAEECIDQEVDVVLGPGVNIKRDPRCGRNFEYFSEDPYLAGEMGASYVNGVQKHNVGTSLKHFCANSQEYKRMTIDSVVDERTMREIYLPAFENTVKKAQPYTIMCSYNRINGEYAADNKYVLTDILRDEWGFAGIVLSDWGATNDRVKGILAGMDLEMPTSNGERDKLIKKAVEDGTLSEEDLDKVVERMLTFIFKCYENRKKHENNIDYNKNYEIACDAATSGAVLLKNDGILPLKEGKKIAVIGNMAREMRYQGGGSSRINPKKLTSFVDYLHENKVEFDYADGYGAYEERPDAAKIEEAKLAAKDKDTVLLFVGLTDVSESEAFDRAHLAIPESHNELVKAILEVNKNVVVVLACGSPMEMPWINDVRAVLNMYLCGEAGGKACYKLLFGKANPSGKLAETFPLGIKDNPASLYFGMGPRTVEYREGLYVGYRYYDKTGKDVLFPFGYGLSYTEFTYGDLRVSADNIGADDVLTVTFSVTNTGKFDGAEVCQVYVRDVESSVYREDKALKGFEKVFLKVGETKEVTVRLDKRSFAFYDVERKDWVVETGEFEILVGASSRDVRLSAKVFVNGVTDVKPTEEGTFYKDPKGYAEIPSKEFENLLGRELPCNEPYKKGEMCETNCIRDIDVCSFGKFFKWLVYKAAPLAAPKNSPASMRRMLQEGAMDLPLRNMYAMTNGIVPRRTVEGLIVRLNSYPFKGMGRFIGSFLKKKPQRKDAIYPVK